MHISLSLTLFISTCKHVYRSTQCSLYTAVFLSVFLEHGPVLGCVLSTRDRDLPLSSTIRFHPEMESSAAPLPLNVDVCQSGSLVFVTCAVSPCQNSRGRRSGHIFW